MNRYECYARRMRLAKRLNGIRLVICTIFVLGASQFSHAATISLTGGNSGGNPGNQPLYEVSGLVQGDAFNVSWGGVNGLDVEGMVFIDSLTNTDAEIRIMIDNMSTAISATDPRVTAVGLNIVNFSSLNNASAGGTFLANASSSNFPGFGGINACGTSGNNCAGGGNGGIPHTMMDILTLDVAGNFGGTLTLADFALKVQGGPQGNSFELAGVPTPKVDPQGDIPEPSTVVLLSMAALAVSLRRRFAAQA